MILQLLATDGSKKALIISISDYQDNHLEDLEFCKNDGEQMYQTLTTLGYDIPENHKLIGKVDDITLRNTLIEFFRDENIKTTDTLLFYYSGHGVLDGYEGRYFATSNVNSNIPENNGIPFDMLTQQMDRSPSRKTIAILDCCFSGGAVYGVTGKSAVGIEEEAEKLGKEALNKQFKDSKGNCVLASSLSQRRSYNLPEKKMSAFTYFVVEGLKGKKNSVDKEGYVTPEKLDEYVFTELKNIQGPGQEPVRNLSISGRLVLAHHPELVEKKKESLDEETISKLLQKERQKDREEFEKKMQSMIEKMQEIKKPIQKIKKELKQNSVTSSSPSVDQRDVFMQLEEVRILTEINCMVNAVAITPDGTKIVSGSSDNTIKVWDLSTGKDLLTLKGHKDIVDAVAITPDGTKIVSGSVDKTIKVWDFNVRYKK